MDKAKLIKDLVTYRSIDKAPLVKKLFGLLLKYHEQRLVTNDEIAKSLWGVEPGTYEPQAVREKIQELRSRLDEFRNIARKSEDIRLECDLPDAIVNEGYRLSFEEKAAHDPTGAFWAPHGHDDQITLVYAEPVFFFDIETSGYLRFHDTNPRGNHSDLAVQELKRLHGPQIKALYGEDPETRLRQTRAYVSLGETNAVDELSKWFSKRFFMSARKKSSDRISSLTDCSPILLGSMRTNGFSEMMLDAREGKHFAFRLHKKQVPGFVSIHEAETEEKKVLSKYYKLDTEEGEQTVAGNRPTLSQVRNRLAIVQRMQVPGGRGVVTIISSDTGPAIQQVVKALTDDPHAREIANQAGYGERRPPKSFEMLFSVQIGASSSTDREGGYPELMAYRAYP